MWPILEHFILKFNENIWYTSLYFVKICRIYVSYKYTVGMANCFREKHQRLHVNMRMYYLCTAKQDSAKDTEGKKKFCRTKAPKIWSWDLLLWVRSFKEELIWPVTTLNHLLGHFLNQDTRQKLNCSHKI